ncbi:hypothetical protein, partial [Marinospirillum sp.]|uniref:hypothetical protein n=1 Tax=Marinospirillum sp. TaxID=2183934 RepID=UPI003A8C7C02
MSDQVSDQGQEAYNPAEMFEWMTKANERYQAVIEQLVSRHEGGMSDSSMSVMSDMTAHFQSLGEQLTSNPMVLFDEQMSLMQGQM